MSNGNCMVKLILKVKQGYDGSALCYVTWLNTTEFEHAALFSYIRCYTIVLYLKEHGMHINREYGNLILTMVMDSD